MLHLEADCLLRGMPLIISLGPYPIFIPPGRRPNGPEAGKWDKKYPEYPAPLNLFNYLNGVK